MPLIRMHPLYLSCCFQVIALRLFINNRWHDENDINQNNAVKS
jgi:hypothetical protein